MNTPLIKVLSRFVCCLALPSFVVVPSFGAKAQQGRVKATKKAVKGMDGRLTPKKGPMLTPKLPVKKLASKPQKSEELKRFNKDISTAMAPNLLQLRVAGKNPKKPGEVITETFVYKYFHKCITDCILGGKSRRETARAVNEEYAKLKKELKAPLAFWVLCEQQQEISQLSRAADVSKGKLSLCEVSPFTNGVAGQSKTMSSKEWRKILEVVNEVLSELRQQNMIPGSERQVPKAPKTSTAYEPFYLELQRTISKAPIRLALIPQLHCTMELARLLTTGNGNLTANAIVSPIRTDIKNGKATKAKALDALRKLVKALTVALDRTGNVKNPLTKIKNSVEGATVVVRGNNYLPEFKNRVSFSVSYKDLRARLKKARTEVEKALQQLGG